MSDIVKKYQHYFSESVKLQEVVNEQAAYIEELEEAVTTLSEIFDTPAGKQALNSYRNKATERLKQARLDKKDLTDIAASHKRFMSGPGWGGPGPGGSWPNEDNPQTETTPVTHLRGPRGMLDTRGQRNSYVSKDTMGTLRAKAKEAHRQVTQRKKGLAALERHVARKEAEEEARMDAEAKAKGIDRHTPHMKDEHGRLIKNPYFKGHRHPDEIEPNF